MLRTASDAERRTRADRSGAQTVSPRVPAPGRAVRVLVLAPLSGLFRVVRWVVRPLGDALALHVVWALLVPVLLPGHGQRTRNARRLFGPLGWTGRQCAALSRRSAWHFARSVLDSVRITSMSRAALEERVTLLGEDRLREALASREGVLLVANHLGNARITCAVLGARGYRPTVVGYTVPIASVREQMDSVWRRFGVTIAPLGGGASDVARQVLARGEVFCVYPDVSLRAGRGSWFRLGPAAIEADTGSARLALRTRAPILRITCHAEPGGRYVVSISPAAGREEAAHDERRLLQAWMDAFYADLARWPEQWELMGLCALREPGAVGLTGAATSPAAPAASIATPPRAPGPSRLRLLRDVSWLGGPPLERHVRWARSFGDVVSLSLRRPPSLQLNGPEDIRHVLVTNGRNYRKTGWLVRGRDFLGNGLLTSMDPWHAQQRNILKPGFHRRQVASHAQLIVDGAEACAAAWTSGAIANVSAAMGRLTIVNAGRAFLDTDLGGSADDLMAAFRVCQQFMMRATSCLPDRLPTPLARRYAAAVRRIDDVVGAVIAARRARPAGSDVLSLLLSARGDDGRPLGDRAVRDEVVTLLWAGHETTSGSLEWSWFLLARHPEVRARLRAELDRVLGGRPPTVDDLAGLEYTDMVFSESLRLYPPAWILSRWAMEDDTLPSGFPVPRGTQVAIVPYVVHRDPRYFPDPGRFDPDRFTPERRAGRPSFAYFPFGGGPRVCIGEHFGRMQGVLTLATIAQRWTLDLAPGHRVTPAARLTLGPASEVLMRATRHA